jgi:hypothetical protein
MIRWKRSWAEPSEALPVDVLPCSNGEFVPLPPTRRQLAIMALAEHETDRWARRFGMSRRRFVRTAAATTIGLWAVDAVARGRYGHYALADDTATTQACDLAWTGQEGDDGKGTLRNLPGEFIFDVQSHHVDPEGLWRVNNPAIHAFFAAIWPQSSALTGDRPGIREDGSIRGGGAGELDPIENLSRFHYLKELFLDSATTATVLSCVPSSPDTENPLPIAEAAATVDTVNLLAGASTATPRSVLHAFVMPNRGSGGNSTPGMTPLYLQEELDLMMQRAQTYGEILRGWKTYCAWGDIPNASGWALDDPAVGHPFLEQVLAVSAAVPSVPPVVATHKGFALPGFDQRSAAPRDVGPAAAAFPGVRFVVYHSGYDSGDTQTYYDGSQPPGDDTTNHVDSLLNSLRKAGLDAQSPRGLANGGNSPNVWAELGSVWRDCMGEPDQAAHLLGKLITWVGPKRIAWGTDSLWYGSPQPEIVALRRFEFTEEGKALYGLPHGLEGDRNDPQRLPANPADSIRNGILGRNAAEAYEVDADAARNAIACDDVQATRAGYLTDVGTLRESAPLASNQLLGARTRRELFESLRGRPWAP